MCQEKVSDVILENKGQSHKHTYLASCHHVGELGVLINGEAQNVITVFHIETLAG